MINVESLQDLKNMGIDVESLLAGKETEPKENADTPEWIIDLLNLYNIDDKNDRKNLSIMIERLCEYQKELDRLLKDRNILDLMYGYSKFDARKIASIQPMKAPVGFAYYFKRSKEQLSMECETITAKTRKLTGSTTNLFDDIQVELMETLFAHIDEPIQLKTNQLEEYIHSENYDDIFYDKSKILDPNSFSLLVGNGVVVKYIESLQKKTIGVEKCFDPDEILLRKGTAQEGGFVFCPYIIPLNTMEKYMARYAIFISPYANDLFKRVKIIV